MTDQDDELSPDLEMAAQLLSEGSTDAVAGAAVGRSAKWVQRARKDTPAFPARVQALKQERAEQAAAALSNLLEGAVEAVQRSLNCGRPADELRAAAMVFDRYRSFRDDTAPYERLVDLEAEVDAMRSELGLDPTESGETAS